MRLKIHDKINHTIDNSEYATISEDPWQGFLEK